MCVLAVLVLGTIALSQLPIDLMPDLSSCGGGCHRSGASPAEEEPVTRPIEARRLSRPGEHPLSPADFRVIIEFDWGRT